MSILLLVHKHQQASKNEQVGSVKVGLLDHIKNKIKNGQKLHYQWCKILPHSRADIFSKVFHTIVKRFIL
jgi:hypothetical protein